MFATPSTWLDLLDAYRVPFTPRAALDYLAQQSARCAILGCYRVFFPTQWAASVASLLPDAEHAYSPREWECFRLVNQHLFPLDLDWLGDSDDDPDNRTLTLPITPIGIDWWDSGAGYFRPGIQMLLVLAGAIPPEYTDLPESLIQQLHQARAGRGEPLWLPPHRALPPPLTALRPAYEWIHHDTGNAWLDAVEENPIDMEWNQADVEWCAAEYKAAQALLAPIYTLIEWLEADPLALLEVITECSPPPTT
jgi:hypothetical protein